MKITTKLHDTKLELSIIPEYVNYEISIDDMSEYINCMLYDKFDVLEQKFKNILESLNDVNHELWPVVFDKKHVNSIILRTLTKFNDIQNSNSKYDYFETWLKIRTFLSGFKSVSINKEKLEEIVALHKNINVCYESDYTLSKIVYSTSGSSTGRLTISSGTNVLVINKHFHEALVCDDDSNIVMIDFSSLEPRVALMISKNMSCENDIYEEIVKQCGLTTREVAKQATISTLYGMSQHHLSELVSSVKDAKTIVNSVNQFFDTKNLDNILQSMIHNQKIITNMFGRPLFEASKIERIRRNHFIQSSAADLANILFSEFVNAPGVEPLFVKHDALFFVCKKTNINNVKMLSQQIKFKDINFPVKMEIIR